MDVNQSGAFDVAALRPHDHVCFSFREDAEYLGTVTRYVEDGLARNEKVLCFTDRFGQDRILGRFQPSARIEEALERGQLAFVDARAAYTGAGPFDPDTMLATFAGATQQALGEGYTALRAAAEMAWVVPDVIDRDALVEYEFRCERFCTGALQIGLCAYDARACDPELLESLHAVHARSLGMVEPPLLRASIRDGRTALHGELDVTTVPLLERILGALDADGADPELDLADLRFVDAAGLRALYRFAVEQSPHRRIILHNARRLAAYCVRLLGMESALPLGNIQEQSA